MIHLLKRKIPRLAFKVLPTISTSDKSKYKDTCVTVDGKKYEQYNMARKYNVSKYTRSKNIPLVNRGFNGGISWYDIRCVSTCSDETLNIIGIDKHQLTSTPIIGAGGVSQSKFGPVIPIFTQYADHGKGKLIHSPVQLE